jgi:dipeptidyl aminopeptidase/acylaminoacyl peptidase
MGAARNMVRLTAITLLSSGAFNLPRAQSATDNSSMDLYQPTFEDLLELREFDELAVSPEGRWVAYIRSARFHADTGGVHERVLLLDLHSRNTRILPVNGHPHALQWAPQGDVLGFLATSGGRDRLWRYLPRESAPPEPIIESEIMGGDLLAYAWSSTGDSVAYIAPEPAGEESDRETGAAHAPPRLVIFRDAPGDFTGETSPAYRRDSIGAYLAVADVGGSTSRVLVHRVISRKFSPTVGWSRTGMLLVSGAPIGVDWLHQITTGLLCTVDVSTGEVHEVQPDSLARLNPVWSPSGHRIASLEYHTYREGGAHQQTFALRVEDPARTEAETVHKYEAYGAPTPFSPVWGADDNSIYVARYENGTARLYLVDLASDQWHAITPESLSVSRYAVRSDGKAVLAVLENANQPQRLYSIDPVTDELTDLATGTDTLWRLKLGHVEQVAWTSSDARFRVHGFLVKPPGYDPSRRYPLIVMVHGGPGALFTNTFLALNFWQQGYIPPQWLALNGYLVLLPNPRGDGSYGDAFETAIQDDWGPGPSGDIEAGVSALIAAGIVDSTAVGIAGVSYGGYLAAFAITQSRRFAAASIDDGPTDLSTDYGVNYAFHSLWFRFFFGGTPSTKPDLYAAQSPITFVDKVRTPVLMRYGGQGATHDDIRQSYTLAQGFQFYAGLRDAGVPVEFVLHPDQGHSITDWELYKDWVRRNVRWFDFWLRHEGLNPTNIPE